MALNRREYRGSTPFSDAEKAVVSTGTDEQKLQWLRDRGNEIATFIHTFIRQHGLPPASANGKSGGVALLGWSLGVSTTMATVANVDSFAPEVQQSLASHLRAHIMHGSKPVLCSPASTSLIHIRSEEPPSGALGLPRAPKHWTPRLDESLPMHVRVSKMTRWLTGYFAHGDLSTRDLDVIEYVLHSTSRIPSLWNMSPKDIADIIDEGPHLVVDAPIITNCQPQAAATYKKGMYSPAARGLLPKMKVWELVGDATLAPSLTTLWFLQDDDAAHGGGFINYKVIPGHNHFVRPVCLALRCLYLQTLILSYGVLLEHVGRPRGDSPSVSEDVGIASPLQLADCALRGHKATLTLLYTVEASDTTPSKCAVSSLKAIRVYWVHRFIGLGGDNAQISSAQKYSE